MTRALIVMVLSLGSLVFSFRPPSLSAASAARRNRARHHIAHLPDSSGVRQVRVLHTPIHEDRARRGRAVGALVVACLVGGLGLGLAIVVALSALTVGVSGLPG